MPVAVERPRPKLLSTREAVKFLGGAVSAQTLTTWRCTKRQNIPYLKIGRLVYYDVADLLAWLESRKVRG